MDRLPPLKSDPLFDIGEIRAQWAHVVFHGDWGTFEMWASNATFCDPLVQLVSTACSMKNGYKSGAVCFPEEPGEYLLVLERESGDSLRVEWHYSDSISGESSRRPDANTKLVHSGFWSAYQFSRSVAHAFVPLRSGSLLEDDEKQWGRFPFHPLERLLAGRWT